MERVLETIVERSRPELEAAKRHVPASELRRRIADAPPVRDFTGSLRKPGLRVIAELKAASPSKGVIRLPLEGEWQYGTTRDGMSVIQFNDSVLSHHLRNYIYNDITPTVLAE